MPDVSSAFVGATQGQADAINAAVVANVSNPTAVGTLNVAEATKLLSLADNDASLSFNLSVTTPTGVVDSTGQLRSAVDLAMGTSANTNQANYLKLYQAIKTGANPVLNTGFQLNSEETISSDFIFVRVRNSDYNYSTNPSMISGSGELVYPTLINNPQTYITTVGLYNDNNDLLAVAKLSKPLVKNFTKEALVRVKLNW
jgi:hypothetical protein